MMQIARQKGISWFLIDGSIRDYDAVNKFDEFAIFARAIQPNASFKGLGPGEINVPISVGGVVIFLGDIIVGDQDGVVAMRPYDAKIIAQQAQELCNKEAANFELILKGKSDRSWVIKALEDKGCIFLDKSWDEI